MYNVQSQLKKGSKQQSQSLTQTRTLTKLLLSLLLLLFCFRFLPLLSDDEQIHALMFVDGHIRSARQAFVLAL